jgi:5-methylcytosine-specific restriction endonuclease McrA
MRIMHADRAKECAVSGRVDRLELHHILPRSQGGDDVRANLVWLVADIHHRVTANDPVAMRLLGEHIKWDRPDTVAYLRAKLNTLGRPSAAQEWMGRRLYIEEA